MTLLKPEQIDTSLRPADDPILASYTLAAVHTIDNAASITTITRSQDRVTAIRNALEQDDNVSPLLPYLRNTALPCSEDIAESLEPYTLDVEGLLLRNGLVYIPAVDALKLEILKDCHDAKTAGHMGQEKTLELVLCNYH